MLIVATGVVPAIPGSIDDAAMLMDLQALDRTAAPRGGRASQPARAWVTASDAVVHGRGDARLSRSGRASSPSPPIRPRHLGSAAVALWVAAAGGVALAVLAVGAVAGAQLRSRRDEVVVLRAVGVESQRQGAVRRLEMLAVLAYGVIAGVVGGVASTLLTVSALARAAVPRRYASLATAPMFDPLLLAAELGLLLAPPPDRRRRVRRNRGRGRHGD